MFGYIVYFIFTIFCLLLPKKIAAYAFPLIWFCFVGLRDGIGTDYFGTLLVVERGFINIDDPWLSFIGYNLVDTELVYRLLSTIFYTFDFDIIYFHVLLAAIQSILIFCLLKKVHHKKVLIFYFLCLYTLHFPMNAQRQGFALLILIFATNIYYSKVITKGMLIFTSMMSHYATIPLILLSSVNIKNKLFTFAILLLSSLVIVNFGDLISLRWPSSASQGYESSGFGLKLVVGAILLLLINFYVVEKSLLSKTNVIIFALMLGTMIYGPFGRYYHFYAHFILFTNLFLIGNRRLNVNKLFFLVSYPVFYSLTIWHEISRFVPFSGGGVWLPYKNLFINF